MTEQNLYQLREDEYHAWIASLADDDVVGVCTDPYRCSIGTFLTQKYARTFYISDPSFSNSLYFLLDRTWWWVLPAWARKEIEFFDDLEQLVGDVQITARAYRREGAKR